MSILKRFRRWQMRRELRSIERDINALRERAGRFNLTSEWTNDILLKGKNMRVDALRKELDETKD